MNRTARSKEQGAVADDEHDCNHAVIHISCDLAQDLLVPFVFIVGLNLDKLGFVAELFNRQSEFLVIRRVELLFADCHLIGVRVVLDCYLSCL